MKKIFLSLCVAALAVTSQAQGLVNFNNGSTTLMTTNVTSNVGVGGSIAGAGSYYYALFYSPSTTTALQGKSDPTLSGYTFSGLTATNVSAPGRIIGTPGTGASVNGLTAGDVYNVIVVGWSSSLGTTWAQVEAQLANQTQSGFFGISSVGTLTAGGALGGGGTQPTPSVFGSGGGGQLTGFTLTYYPAPEPGTIALAGLGVAGLLALRRKK